MGEYKVVFVEVGEAEGTARFERLPVDIEEREGGEYVAVRHGIDAGQSVVVGGASALSQRL